MSARRLIVVVLVSTGLCVAVVLLAVFAFDIGHSRSARRQSTSTISRAQTRDDAGVFAAIPGAVDFASSSPNRCVHLKLTYSHDKGFVKVEPVRTKCAGYGGNPGFEFLHWTGTRWTKVFEGSPYPPCALGIPGELTRCYRGEAKN